MLLRCMYLELGLLDTHCTVDHKSVGKINYVAVRMHRQDGTLHNAQLYPFIGVSVCQPSCGKTRSLSAASLTGLVCAHTTSTMESALNGVVVSQRER